MEYFFALVGVVALVLLWDIYKQLRYINDKLSSGDKPQASMTSIYSDLKDRAERE